MDFPFIYNKHNLHYMRQIEFNSMLPIQSFQSRLNSGINKVESIYFLIKPMNEPYIAPVTFSSAPIYAPVSAPVSAPINKSVPVTEPVSTFESRAFTPKDDTKKGGPILLSTPDASIFEVKAPPKQ